MTPEIADQDFEKCLMRLPFRAYCARVVDEPSGRRLVVYTLEKGRRAMESALGRCLADAGLSMPSRVARHRLKKLSAARSLESMQREFGRGRLVFDPTGSVGRVEAIVSCAKRVRKALGPAVSTIALDSSRRTLFVILAEGAEQGGARRIFTSGCFNGVGLAVDAWRRETRPDFALAVRVGYVLPSGVDLVPVDSGSVPGSTFTRLRNGLERAAAAAGVAALFGLSGAQSAGADGPAVSQANATIIGAGGVVDAGTLFNDDGWAWIGGKVTAPLSRSFGVQLDAAVGSQSYHGVAGHLFWRDPDIGLVGGIASYESLNDNDMTRIGVEFEYYKQQFTLAGRAGQQSGDVGSGFFGRLDLSYYHTPNLVLNLGVETMPGNSLGRLGFEWMPANHAIAGLSFFADSQFGGDNYFAVMAGLKWHFGDNFTSLQDRARRQEVAFALPNIPPGYATEHPGP